MLILFDYFFCNSLLSAEKLINTPQFKAPQFFAIWFVFFVGVYA